MTMGSPGGGVGSRVADPEGLAERPQARARSRSAGRCHLDPERERGEQTFRGRLHHGPAGPALPGAVLVGRAGIAAGLRPAYSARRISATRDVAVQRAGRKAAGTATSTPVAASGSSVIGE